MSEQTARWPKPPSARRKARRRRVEARRFRVHYDLAYDGGGSEWDGYYRTRAGAVLAIWWNRHVSSWGGSAELYDRDAHPWTKAAGK